MTSEMEAFLNKNFVRIIEQNYLDRISLKIEVQIKI
jgi:hypothetical protein